MNNGSPHIELERQIDAYIKGKLTEKEAQDLWRELIKRPDYINRLETEIDIVRYYQQQANPKNNYKQYWRWTAAAAVVILVVVGLNLFSSESLNDYTVERIFLRENLATADIMRSAESEFERVDSLLNLGFEKAVNGKVEKALSVYHKIVSVYPNTVYAAKSHLNIGILSYNEGDFAASIANFEKVFLANHIDDFFLEQSYWFAGNAFIHVEAFEQAKKALQKAYGLNGKHRKQARRLLKKLDKKLGQ